MNAFPGISAANLPKANAADHVLSLKGGSLGLVELGALAALVQTQIGPTHETHADLLADLSWEPGARAVVWNDPEAAKIGIYEKTGPSGNGTWTYRGDGAYNAALEMARLAQSAAAASAAAASLDADAVALASAQLELAAMTAGSPFGNDAADGLSRTTNGQTFFVRTSSGLLAFRNEEGSSRFLGWLGPVEVQDVAAFFALSGAFEPGQVVSSRAENYRWLAVGSDGHVSTAGGQSFLVVAGDHGAAALRQFGAAGDGVTDDLAQITSAFASGLKLTGEALTYGVAGAAALGSGLHLQDAVFKQLAPGSLSAVTLSANGADNLTLRNVGVLRNGDGTNGGTLEASGATGARDTAFGISIIGGTGHVIDGLEVSGDDSGTLIRLKDFEASSFVQGLRAHSANCTRSAISAELIRGIHLDNCSTLTLRGVRGHDLTTTVTGSAAAEAWTVGIEGADCTRVVLDGPQIARVGREIGFDSAAGNVQCGVQAHLGQQLDSMIVNAHADLATALALITLENAFGTGSFAPLSISGYSVGGNRVTLYCADTSLLEVGDYVKIEQTGPAVDIGLRLGTPEVIALTPNVSFDIELPLGLASVTSAPCSARPVTRGNIAGLSGSSIDGFSKSPSLQVWVSRYAANRIDGLRQVVVARKGDPGPEYHYQDNSWGNVDDFKGMPLTYGASVKALRKVGACTWRPFINCDGTGGGIRFGPPSSGIAAQVERLQVTVAEIPKDATYVHTGIEITGAVGDALCIGKQILVHAFDAVAFELCRNSIKDVPQVVKLTAPVWFNAQITFPSAAPTSDGYEFVMRLDAETELAFRKGVASFLGMIEGKNALGARTDANQHTIAFKSNSAAPVKHYNAIMHSPGAGEKITESTRFLLGQDATMICYSGYPGDVWGNIAFDKAAARIR